jgi:hypothetical protein
MLVESSMRHRIDVAYSGALGKWTVSLTGPGEPGSGVHRTHVVLGAHSSADAAVQFADDLKQAHYPLSKVTVFGAPI